MKPYIEINAELRKKLKNEFEKDFFKLMNNFIFGKTMEKVRNYRDVKLVTKDERRNQLISEPDYQNTFQNILMTIEMKKTKAEMNKPVYIAASRLYISKTLVYEFWYDYIEPKYGNRAKPCYILTALLFIL